MLARELLTTGGLRNILGRNKSMSRDFRCAGRVFEYQTDFWGIFGIDGLFLPARLKATLRAVSCVAGDRIKTSILDSALSNLTNTANALAEASHSFRPTVL